MRNTWISGGLLIAGLMVLGFAIDQISNKENFFSSIGFGLGCLLCAIIILNKKK